ncbi:MAG: FHA domain-containing protein [Solobacterium sp.]|nr:FHA domain-containing protein [Solobacterium sp.]
MSSLLNDPEITKLIIYALAGMVGVLLLALLFLGIKRNIYYIDEDGNELGRPKKVKGKKKEKILAGIITDEEENTASTDMQKIEEHFTPKAQPVAVKEPDVTAMILTIDVNGEVRDQTVDSFPCTIGRADSCGVQILESSVSRNAAVITLENGVPYIEDLNGRNGTFHNDVRLLSSGKTRLRNGDVVNLGRAEVTVGRLI